MAKFDDSLPHVHPTDRTQWREWLAQNHDKSRGAWLVFYKKTTGLRELSYDEAVEEAICWGWIDSKANKLDAHRYKLMMTPRKPGSGWSRVNKKRIEALEQQGLLAPPGLAKIEAARQDGSWDLLDRLESLDVPEILQKALDANPAAAAFYQKLTDSKHRQVHYHIRIAKQEATQRARVQKIVEEMAQGIVPFQWYPNSSKP